MRRLKTSIFFLFLLFISCHESEIAEVNQDIEKAKKWFQLNEVRLSKLTSNSSARVSSQISKIPDWSKSKVHSSKSGMNAVEVVLDYENYIIPSNTETVPIQPNSINSMILFEVKPGDYEVYLLKIYPDNPSTKLSKENFDRFNYGKVPNDFSGRVMVFDWDENFIGGWRIQNGERSKHIIRTENNYETNGRTSRTNTILCYQITTYWFQVSCWSGGCGDPVLIDVSTTIECEYILAPGDDSGSGGPGDPEANTCFTPHPFIEGLMVPCEQEQLCDNGFIRDWNGNCYCPSAMEIINGRCTFKCPNGYRRNEAGVCVQIQNCNTNDPIINAIQAQLDALWKTSNASHTSIPMADRLENGGWVVNGPNGYSFTPFPSTWIRTPCGIDLPANWVNDIPSNVVGTIHTHPFYVGEDRRSVCGYEGVEPAYVGGPSRPDAKFLYEVGKRSPLPFLKGYVIDGNNIHTYFALDEDTNSLTSRPRCAY